VNGSKQRIIHTMRHLFLLPFLGLLIGCRSSLVGTYRDDGVGRLHDALTLFPDSTYHYQYWADIPLGDEGQWSLNGDTLRLERSWGKDDQWLVRGKRLMIIDPNADMLARARGVGEQDYRIGTSEHTGVPEACTDLIIAACHVPALSWSLVWGTVGGQGPEVVIP
jgi:hypothetical protein